MGLQTWGRADMGALLDEMSAWRAGAGWRSALRQPGAARGTLTILDRITADISNADPDQRKGDDFHALRKGMACCWSVAVAACPDKGKPLFEKWLVSKDPDVRWVMKQNLAKKRLERMDPEWVERLLLQDIDP